MHFKFLAVALVLALVKASPQAGSSAVASSVASSVGATGTVNVKASSSPHSSMPHATATGASATANKPKPTPTTANSDSSATEPSGNAGNLAAGTNDVYKLMGISLAAAFGGFALL